MDPFPKKIKHSCEIASFNGGRSSNKKKVGGEAEKKKSDFRSGGEEKLERKGKKCDQNSKVKS